MMTIQQALELAFQHHEAGRLVEAETLYRQILSVQPGHADALHYLGVIVQQAGRKDLALDWIRQAAVRKPWDPFVHFHLANVLGDLGRLDEAVAGYSHALALRPQFPEAYNNLGIVFAAAGRAEEAIAAYRRALELKPSMAKAHNNLGNLLRERGQRGEAMECYRRAIEADAHLQEAYNNLGLALVEDGKPEEAMTAFLTALQVRPSYTDASNNLGAVLRSQGRLVDAENVYRSALELAPEHPGTHNNLGVALAEQGQTDLAIAQYRRALELQPGSAEVWNNLGKALKDKRHLSDAIAAYQRAIELKPDLVETYNNLGTLLKDQGRVDEAIASYRRALAFQPDFPDSHNNLGNALKDQGDIEGSIAEYRRTLELKPEHIGARDNLIYTLNFLRDGNGTQIAEEQRCWNQLFCEPAKRFIQPHTNQRDPARRLRIGYVSPDFCCHVIGQNLIPLFEHHDHREFEIVCYSGVVREDEWTAEFRRRADLWRTTLGVTDEALAKMIREDGVDLLVDLSQHMSGNRLAMFARHPAPVQVSFAGYPDSAGVDAIKYRISDRQVEGSDDGTNPSREQVMLLDSFWCYAPKGVEITVNELPALENGWVMFGSLNNFCKINEPLLKLWAKVLEQAPASRLLLLCLEGSHRQRVLEVFRQEGIETHRVEFAERCPRREYLELYHRVDIVLDPFPYNGHTTSLDALWMGVPVVSLAGKSRVSRGGLSILSNLGLSELAAKSEEDYVATAVRLAQDVSRLEELRRTLRARMESSVLMDEVRFARGIESAFREMWRRWCEG